MYFLFSMKTFARCVWSEGDDKKEEEATILGSWVNEEEKTMRWPTKINVIRALMEQRDPEPHWKTFKLLKVKLRSNSLQECDDYNYTTSLETEDEDNTIDVGLQNVTKASGKSDSSGKAARSSGQKASSGMGASSQVSTFQKPRLPSVKPLSTAVSNKASASPIYHSSSKTKSYPERENTSPDLENDFTPPPKRRRHIEDESISTPPSRVTKRMSKSLFPLSDETYQYKTINLLFDIREELRKLTNDKEIDHHDNNLQEFQICESVEDFEKFEDNLTNPAYNKNMLKSMSKVGGNSWKDNTRNVMRRLMKNRL
eukprot:TCONS_00033884-protein